MKWKTLSFNEAVQSRGAGASGLSKKDWKHNGKFPVIGQGTKYIEGWTDREDLVIDPSPNGLVLYGGHTRRAKHVSTQFVPGPNVKILQPKEILDSKFLFYFLYQIDIENKGYADHFPLVKRVKIPIPPLAEQKRISAILEYAEALKKKRAEADKIVGMFVPALFSKLFGNQDWESFPISDIAEVKIGPFGTQLHAKDYIEDGIPLINPTHIVEGKIKTNNHLTISVSKAKTLPQYMVRTGDVVLGRRGEMGRCAVVTELEDGYMCGTGSLFLTPNTNKINPIYLQKMLSSEGTKKVLEENAKGITMKNLNITIVNKIKIPLPPLVLQNQFAEVVKEAEIQEVKQKQSAESIDNVFQSLLAQVFRSAH